MEYEAQSNNSNFSIWKALIKKWFIIAIAFVICFGVAIAYSAIKIKPVYTAQTSIVLKLAISGDIVASNNTNNATLAKRNFPTVKESLKSAQCAEVANAHYNEKNGTVGNNISKGAIQVRYGEKSMIFTLGYTDVSADVAKAKLESIIETAPGILETVIEANSVDLVPVQNVYDISVSDQKSMIIPLGAIVGLVLGVGIALLICLLDNKVRKKEDIEDLTGVNVIACVNSEIK